MPHFLLFLGLKMSQFRYIFIIIHYQTDLPFDGDFLYRKTHFTSDIIVKGAPFRAIPLRCVYIDKYSKKYKIEVHQYRIPRCLLSFYFSYNSSLRY